MAIILVLCQHAPTRPLIDGFVGVTVFFCLSGYLITTLLIRELDAGTIRVPAFYRRRVARLSPALVTVVSVTVVVLLISRHAFPVPTHLSVGQIFAPAGAAVVYTTSIFDWTGHFFATQDYLNFTWSLSIEEQFYLMWPFVLLWGYRRNPRLFAGLTVVFIGITLAINLYLGLSQQVIFDAHEYLGSDTNALPILVGALLAIVVHNGWVPRALAYLAPWTLLAVVLLPVLGYRNDTEHTSLVTVAGTVLTLVILVGVETRPRSAVGSVLASRPMQWLGQRSYSIYLWNDLARIVILKALGYTFLGDIVWIALFVVVAETSYRFIERPLRAKLSGRSRTRHAGQPAPEAPATAHVSPAAAAVPDAEISPAVATDPVAPPDLTPA